MDDYVLQRRLFMSYDVCLVRCNVRLLADVSRVAVMYAMFCGPQMYMVRHN